MGNDKGPPEACGREGGMQRPKERQKRLRGELLREKLADMDSFIWANPRECLRNVFLFCRRQVRSLPGERTGWGAGRGGRAEWGLREPASGPLIHWHHSVAVQEPGAEMCVSTKARHGTLESTGQAGAGTGARQNPSLLEILSFCRQGFQSLRPSPSHT